MREERVSAVSELRQLKTKLIFGRIIKLLKRLRDGKTSMYRTGALLDAALEIHRYGGIRDNVLEAIADLIEEALNVNRG